MMMMMFQQHKGNELVRLDGRKPAGHKRIFMGQLAQYQAISEMTIASKYIAISSAMCLLISMNNILSESAEHYLLRSASSQNSIPFLRTMKQQILVAKDTPRNDLTICATI